MGSLLTNLCPDSSIIRPKLSSWSLHESVVLISQLLVTKFEKCSEFSQTPKIILIPAISILITRYFSAHNPLLNIFVSWFRKKYFKRFFISALKSYFCQTSCSKWSNRTTTRSLVFENSGLKNAFIITWPAFYMLHT